MIYLTFKLELWPLRVSMAPPRHNECANLAQCLRQLAPKVDRIWIIAWRIFCHPLHQDWISINKYLRFRKAAAKNEGSFCRDDQFYKEIHAVKHQIEVVAILELKKAAITNWKAGNSNFNCTTISDVTSLTSPLSINVVQKWFEFPSLWRNLQLFLRWRLTACILCTSYINDL